MTVIDNIAIPESLMKKVRELSEKEGISVDQFISSAIAEKASAWSTIEYLSKRAERGSREKFLNALSKVPEAAPSQDDRLD
jgi:hypothetical protein